MAIVPSAGLATPRVAADFFGLNSQYVLDAGAPAAALDAAVAGLGVRTVRFDINWQGVQATRGAPFDWSRYDGYFGRLADRGLSVYAILDYSSTWASSIPGEQKAPPLLDSDFARFATAVAERYGSGGSFWATRPPGDAGLAVTRFEVWNEPNLNSTWKPLASPRAIRLHVRGGA